MQDLRGGGGGVRTHQAIIKARHNKSFRAFACNSNDVNDLRVFLGGWDNQCSISFTQTIKRHNLITRHLYRKRNGQLGEAISRVNNAPIQASAHKTYCRMWSNENSGETSIRSSGL